MSKPRKFKTKRKNKNYKVIILGVLILLLVLILAFAYIDLPLKQNKNTEISVSNDDISFYDEERCRCVERERLRCSDDSWELDIERRLCVKGKDITNVILACSKYECAGDVYEFNFENQKWEK